MKPIGMDTIGENNDSVANYSFLSDITNNEILSLIDNHISVKNRPIFLRLRGGSKVPKAELKKLISEIQKILKSHDIKS